MLQDLSDVIQPETLETREKLIKAGKKAYDTIPLEVAPTNEELCYYERAIRLAEKDIAIAVKNLAERIYKARGREVVLVSLIRGGITIGVLIKRYLEKTYNIEIPHYAITLIGTKGIDETAVEHILTKFDAGRLQFVDGWTGKGAVKRTLEKSLQKYKGINSEIAVLSDPANILDLCGTHEDILITNACLNSPLAGLLSRAIPQENNFFGAVFFKELLEFDKTYDFINRIEGHFDFLQSDFYTPKEITHIDGLLEVQEIANEFNINDIHFIKPGMGETMRALIRKKPDIILMNSKKNKYTEFLFNILKEKNILIKEYPLINFNVCGIYTNLNSDIL